MDTLHQDTGLLKQRHELDTMEIQGADEEHPYPTRGSGCLFTGLYHKRIDKWFRSPPRAELLQEALIFQSTSCWSQIFSTRLFLWSSQPTRMMFGSLRLPRNRFDNMGSIHPELERRRAAAFRTWTRFHPVWFRGRHPIACSAPFFSRRWCVSQFCFRVSESLRLRSPGIRIFGPFHLGSWAKDDERKSDNYYETGKMAQRKSAQSTEGRCGISWAWYHLPRNFTLVAFNGTRIS